MTTDQVDAGGWGRPLRIGVPALSSALFALSLAFPAITIHRTDLPEGPQTMHGLHLLISGWTALFLDWIGFVWFANPLLLVGWSLAAGRHWRNSFGFAALSTALTATMLGVDKFGRWFTDPELRFDLDSLQPGYFLWLAAMVVALAGSVAGLKLDPGRRATTPPSGG